MKIYLFLANGFETIEALAPVDVFRRAGIDICTVSISDQLTVTSSHGVEVKADRLLSETNLSDGQAVVLPGGYPGYVNLAENERVGQIVKSFYDDGRLVGAICGAPTVLQRYGIGKGSRLTCHHSVRNEMMDYTVTGQPTEKDRNLITADGAGHAVDFGLALLDALAGAEAVARVKSGMELTAQAAAS